MFTFVIKKHLSGRIQQVKYIPILRIILLDQMQYIFHQTTMQYQFV